MHATWCKVWPAAWNTAAINQHFLRHLPTDLQQNEKRFVNSLHTNLSELTSWLCPRLFRLQYGLIFAGNLQDMADMFNLSELQQQPLCYQLSVPCSRPVVQSTGSVILDLRQRSRWGIIEDISTYPYVCYPCGNLLAQHVTAVPVRWCTDFASDSSLQTSSGRLKSGGQSSQATKPFPLLFSAACLEFCS